MTTTLDLKILITLLARDLVLTSHTRTTMAASPCFAQGGAFRCGATSTSLILRAVSYGDAVACRWQTQTVRKLDREMFDARRRHFGDEHARDGNRELKGMQLLSSSPSKIWLSTRLQQITMSSPTFSTLAFGFVANTQSHVRGCYLRHEGCSADGLGIKAH